MAADGVNAKGFAQDNPSIEEYKKMMDENFARTLELQMITQNHSTRTEMRKMAHDVMMKDISYVGQAGPR